MDAVAASINALNVGTKRPNSPPRGHHYRDDDGHSGDKRGKYGDRLGDRRGDRHCAHCFARGWDKYSTHNSADCFQHPNRATAQHNWNSYKRRADVPDRRRRPESRDEDRRDTNRSDSRQQASVKPSPSEVDIQAMVEREAARRVQQLQDQAAQQQRDRKIDELHQAVLSHDRRREHEDRST